MDALSELGHSTGRVENVNRNGRQLPLFLVDLEPDTNNEEILNLLSILHTNIQSLIAIPDTKSDPSQCHNGHTANYCHRPARCVECGGEHSSDICSKKKSSLAECALCTGDRTSYYKGCTAYKALLKLRKKLNLVITKTKNPQT